MIEPLTHYIKSGDPKAIAHGRDLIASGKVGCIILAGGDGMRLGHDGPKGTFPVSLIKKKTLFQLFTEKVEAANRLFGRTLPVAIMTSPLNDAVTKEHLKEKAHLFDFFMQNMLPMLDETKQPILEARPNGNGEVLHAFYKSGLYKKWKEAGIEYLHVVLVDNALADPFDPNLCGVQEVTGADACIKSVLKERDDEKVGLIGLKDKKVCVIEYSDEQPKEWKLANISLFSFHMDFVEKVQAAELPVHVVQKSHEGKIFHKCEHFIFDLLDHSEKTEVILYPREETFAPLKEKEDLKCVHEALLKKDRKVFFALSGLEPSEKIFELHPSFHYPIDELKEKWKGRSLPDAQYVEP